jgi:hypothetical protein
MPQEQALKARLEAMGVQVNIIPIEGDAFQTEIELRYSFIRIRRATWDLALMDFLERLLPLVPIENAIDSVRIPPGHSVSSALDPKI